MPNNAQIACYDEFEQLEWSGPLEQFLADNCDDEELCDDVRALAPDGELWVGGGAAPFVRLVRS